MSVLDLLLEGFDEGRHPRGSHGRWIATFHHPVHGRTTSPVDAGSSAEAWSKAEVKARAAGSTLQSVAPFKPAEETDSHGGFKVGDRVTFREPTIVNGRVTGHGPEMTREVVGLQRNGYLRVREPQHGTTHDVHWKSATKFHSIGAAARAGALPSQRNKTGRPTGRKYDSIEAAARAGALPSQQPNRQQLHAQVTQHLANLPMGRFHSEAMTGGHVKRTAKGFEVYGHGDAQPRAVHKTPSAAAGHLLRIGWGSRVQASERPQVLDALLVSERKLGGS